MVSHAFSLAPARSGFVNEIAIRRKTSGAADLRRGSEIKALCVQVDAPQGVKIDLMTPTAGPVKRSVRSSDWKPSPKVRFSTRCGFSR